MKKPDPIISQVGLGPVQRPATDPLVVTDDSSASTTTSASVVRKPTGKGRDAAPTAYEFATCMMVASPRGERVAILNRLTGKTSLLQLAVPAGSTYHIEPVGRDELLALAVRDL